jgi:hypothetical protein
VKASASHVTLLQLQVQGIEVASGSAEVLELLANLVPEQYATHLPPVTEPFTEARIISRHNGNFISSMYLYIVMLRWLDPGF